MTQQGFTLWLTGLSGAGKTTVAVALENELHERGLFIERLDGDTVREGLTRDLGFSKEDRDKNIERVCFVAKLLSRNKVGVVASFISPYREARANVRQQTTNFIEVYVNAPLEVCAAREVKGLYAKAFAVTATSSNTAFIPNPSVSYTSPNTNGTLTLAPANNTTGSSLITVSVSDGAATNRQSFIANIKASGNVVPTISVITNRVTSEDTPVTGIPFTVRDSQTPATNLTVTAASLNPALLPTNNITFGGSGTNRTLTLNATGVFMSSLATPT